MNVWVSGNEGGPLLTAKIHFGMLRLNAYHRDYHKFLMSILIMVECLSGGHHPKSDIGTGALSVALK